MSDTVDREEMVAEREFLLRSLDDLDAELVAGNIDPDTYRSLHDDYTARAADVVRALDDGKSTREPTDPRRSPLLRMLTAGGVVLFAVLVAFLLARATGERQPGQTITGNNEIGDGSVTQATLDPNSYEARIRTARTLLGNQDFEGALRAYTAAAAADPTQAEPLAYRPGWISALVARQVDDKATRARLVARALKDFNAAIKLSPEYLDPYFFKGYTLLNLADNPDEAVPALQRFLQLAPSDHPLREQVLGVLAEAQRAADANSKP